MKKIFYLMLLPVFAFSFVGCENDWLDINTSPDNPVSVTANAVLPSVLFFSTQQVYDCAEYGAYLSQCLTTAGKSASGTYAYKVGWGGFLEMNRHPQWRRCYYDIGVNARYLILDAQANNMRNYELIANTLLLKSLMMTTDLFGDIPVKESYAFSLNDADRTPNPKYDTQEYIYDYLEKEFKRVLALYDNPEWINCPTNGVITASEDRMYAGDMNKWRALTKALYARLLVRQIPNRNNTPEMCDKIIAAVDDALTDPGWAEPLYHFDGGSAEKCCMWGPSQPKMNLGWPQARENLLNQAIPSRFMGSIMGFYGAGIPFANSVTSDPDKKKVPMYALDPRATRMMEPRMNKTEKGLRDIPANLEMDVAYNSDYKIDFFPDLYTTTDKTNPYTRDDGYIAYITEEELLFDKAEALYWKGDKQQAYEVTKQAVERSFERYAVRGNLGIVEDDMISLFYELRLPLLGGANGFNISHLMQQKYVAMYLQPEQWNDIRRYNYSTSANGIMYDGVYVYEVHNVFKEGKANVSPKQFTETFPLVRPYNIYTAHWDTGKDKGVSFRLSPNAWINRINPDPETEEKYNRDELIRIGAFQNPDYLRKRMIWQIPLNDGGALTNRGDGEWM